ncbi:MAG: molybdopterin-dependent oxidoreductase [Alphaproteobacteria bacterium]|nr:molybdopterin-dependent oxidoreductase [Alphaproteobacteria bacterium]
MVSRRHFLKLGAVAATATATFTGTGALTNAKEPRIRGGRDYSPLTGKARQAISSACWQCVSRCPIIGYVEDGRLVKVEGQPNSIRTDGKICAKAQAGPNQVYDPDRILYPMKRAGKRGEGKWKRISWDEALTEVAGRLKKLRDEGHPEKFMFHYGRMKASSSKLIKSLFLANYGTGTIGNHTSICEGGKWTAQELTWGKHYDNWDFDNTRYVLNLGSNLMEAHTNHTSEAQRLIKAIADRRIKMVTFDVRLSNTAATSTEWVPVKPGTDIAVLLAMSNVVMNEDLYRGEGEAFLKFVKATPDGNATTEEKVAALKAHLAGYTPEWAEGISGVPAEKIRTIAREFATTKPAVLVTYRGLVAHYYGPEGERAAQMLAAITGNIDNPGVRCQAVGAKWKYPKGPKDKPKAKKLKIVDGFKGQAKLPTHHINHQVFNMIKDGSHGRPEVYMWYCYAPVYSNGDCKANAEVLKDESLIPFTVAVNPFYDESTALADIILPDTTYLERWDWEDMVSPNQIPEHYIRQPLIKPLGEVRNFGDVVCELADRMGFPLGVSSMEEFVEKSCEKTPGVKDVGGFEYMKENGVWHDPKAKPKYYGYRKEVKAEDLAKDGVTLDEATGVFWNWKKAKVKSLEDAKAKGYAHTKKSYKGYVGQKIGDTVYKGFKPDKVNKSGYLEVYSDIMKENGFDPLPTYKAIPEHAVMKPDELILTTFKVNVQTHSRTQNCKWLTEIYHDNPAWINPATAKARGINDGDDIQVASKIGNIKTTARVTPAVAPGVIAISMHCGHWEYGRFASGKKAPMAKQDTNDHMWWKSHGEHPNWIIPNDPDPISGQQRWMDTVVTVRKSVGA